MNGIAFFDFDNTLIDGDVGPLFGQHMFDTAKASIKEHPNHRRELTQHYTKFVPHLLWVGVQTGLYKARALRRSRLVRSAYRMLRGVPAKVYYGEMEGFVQENIPARVFPEMVDIIKEHQSAGRKVVIITTGLEKLVQHCLQFFPPGIEVIGCHLEEKDGEFTGEVTGPLFGADKANIMDAYCRAAGVSLANCWAYTDHFSDYQMLDAAGHGICIRPRSRLDKMAKQKGWEILQPTCPN